MTLKAPPLSQDSLLQGDQPWDPLTTQTWGLDLVASPSGLGPSVTDVTGSPMWRTPKNPPVPLMAGFQLHRQDFPEIPERGVAVSLAGMCL